MITPQLEPMIVAERSGDQPSMEILQRKKVVWIPTLKMSKLTGELHEENVMTDEAQKEKWAKLPKLIKNFYQVR